MIGPLFGALFAAGVEPFILLALFVVSVGIPLVALVATKIREIFQPPAAPPLRRESNDANKIQSQIDEFLRRATQRRTVNDPKEGALSAARKARPVEAEIVDDEPIGDRVGRETQQYLDTSDFGRRSRLMGEGVVEVDKQFKQHVKSAFDNEVSTLSKKRGQSASAPAPLAPESMRIDEAEPMDEPQAQILNDTWDVFSSRDALVQSLVMAEILRRPNWDN